MGHAPIPSTSSRHPGVALNAENRIPDPTNHLQLFSVGTAVFYDV
jgi:hypothetical protein